MNLINTLAACTLAASLAAALPAAAATIVYDNGAPNAFGGNETTAWVQAQDFRFTSATSVGGAGVFLAGFDGIGDWDGGFQYYIFADASGAPGATLASGSASITPTDTGTAWCCVGNAFLFAFDFAAPFLAAANTTYWLGIHASAPGSFTGDNIYWVTTAGNATATGQESFGGTLDNWFGNGADHAFYLTAPSEAPVPAPAGLALFGLGLLGLAALRRAG